MSLSFWSPLSRKLPLETGSLERSPSPCRWRNISTASGSPSGQAYHDGREPPSEGRDIARHSSKISCAGCATSPPRGSTFQIALPANPHAGGNASRWLSHRGVTSFRHTHAPPPVNSSFSPAAAGLICTHLQAHMDLTRIPTNGQAPPWTALIESRSIPSFFHIATITPTHF